jgi:hypothetical protein
MMTDQVALRDRLFGTFTPEHAHRGGTTAAMAYCCVMRLRPPSPSIGQVIDIGFGQGELVRLLLRTIGLCMMVFSGLRNQVLLILRSLYNRACRTQLLIGIRS